MPEKNIFLDYVKAGYPLLWVSTYEEFRAMTAFAKELSILEIPYNFYTWDRCDGVVKKALNNGIFTSVARIGDGLVEPMDVLNWADTQMSPEGSGKFEKKDENAEMPERSILFLKDFHPYIRKDSVYRKVKNLLPTLKCVGKVLVIISHTVDIPPEVEKDITVINYSLPGREDIKIVLKSLCESVTRSSKKKTPVVYPENDEEIIDAALGMTAFEAENAFSVSMVRTKKFDPAVIRREKAAIVKKTGLLEVVETNLSLKDVGGLNNLKAWLEARKNCFSMDARAYGLVPPKGLLMAGLPGTGKSLTAKCTASIFQRPLLRLDVSRIYQKYVGESEDNLRRCLHIAEAIAPCVLFIDELEKAFAGVSSEGDSGVSKRIFGSFLTWMQEKTADVFIVATANDVSGLPPAFLRGGRFDAIFWVDLPDEIQRDEIIRIHLNKVGRNPENFNIPELVLASHNFTGAEIEVWIKEAMILAYSRKEELKTDHLLEKKGDINLIANLMAEEIKTAQLWAMKHGVKPAYIKPAEVMKVQAGVRHLDI